MSKSNSALIFPNKLESYFVAYLASNPSSILEASLLMPDSSTLYSPQAKTDYQHLLDMLQNHETISPFTLSTKPQALSSTQYITALANLSIDPELGLTRDIELQLSTWVNFFKTASAKRELNAWITSNQSLDSAQKILSRNQTVVNTANHISSAVDPMITALDSPQFSISFPFSKIQKYTNGLDKKHLAIVAARTGVGKTVFLQNFALHIAQTKPVLFVSTEMDSSTMLARFVSQLSGHNTRFTPNITQMPEFHEALDQIAKLQIDFLYTTSYQEIYYAASQKKYALVCLDYLQMINPASKYDKDYERISHLVFDIKSHLAGDLDVPVIAAAQFNRESARGGDTPEIWHIRDSGVIEQTADLVISLYQKPEDSELVAQNYQKLRYDILKSRHGMALRNSSKFDMHLLYDKTVFKLLDPAF